MIMKAYVIQELDKEKWKGTYLPVSYTSDFYYDVSVLRTADGFDISVQKMRFDVPFTHVPEDGEFPDRLYEDWWESAHAYGS